MDQDRVSEREAIRIIENENHLWEISGSKLMISDGVGNVAQLGRDVTGTVVAGELGAALRAMEVQTRTDWPICGIFAGSMFWLGVGVSSLVWWVAA